MSKEMGFLPEPPERYVACQHLDFHPVRASLTSDLQNHKTTTVLFSAARCVVVSAAGGKRCSACNRFWPLLWPCPSGVGQLRGHGEGPTWSPLLDHTSAGGTLESLFNSPGTSPRALGSPSPCLPSSQWTEPRENIGLGVCLGAG